MEEKFLRKPASPDEIALYCFMGEAVCKIQHLEAALSCLITVKKNSELTRSEADQALEIQRHSTLGRAVFLAERENLVPLPLQNDLKDFFHRRNWLTHQAMFEHKDDLSTETKKDNVFAKIKSIAKDAEKLQREIELDLINFCESKGKDMSTVLAAMEEFNRL